MPAETAAPQQRRVADPSAQPVVACQQLSKVFKDFWLRSRARAVDRLDLTVRKHEIFGLLGPNGSGKSTTIKLMLGLLRPTSGRIAVFGKAPSDVATKKRIGYLPEESYLYPFLNARETLDYYGRLFEIDPKTRAKRIDELLDMVGLSHAQHRPVREYSKGMQRRIGLAQALINDPELLILDEPTTGLDPIGTRQVKDLILELGRRGKTVILSSHLLADVEDVVDRMVILYGGKIRGEGTCDELLAVHSRTTIETDDLDEDTITEIDRIIRERTGGTKSIRSVHAPRQKLEELFLGIVEQARTERLETSGVQAGGPTAAFLRADEEAKSAEELIDSLVTTDDAPPPSETPSAPEAPSEPEGDKPDAVIDELLEADAPPPSAPPPSAPPKPEDRGDVDDDVIGSLLDGKDKP
ncbi:MAG: ABC transporter ATP-binding protein [Phycisphaerales bacterium]